MMGSYLLCGFLHRNSNCEGIDIEGGCIYPQNSTSDILVTWNKVCLSFCPLLVWTLFQLVAAEALCVEKLGNGRRLKDSTLPTLLFPWLLPIPYTPCHIVTIDCPQGPLPVGELLTYGQTSQLFLPWLLSLLPREQQHILWKPVPSCEYLK